MNIRKSMRKAKKLQKDVLYIKYGTYYALIKLKVFSFIAQIRGYGNNRCSVIS